MVERRRGGDEYERDETSRLIIQAARRLFMAHGYRAVSTRQVAEAVGLTQPALYHHFGTKEELYVAVALGEVARLRAGLERVAHREGSAREQLHGLARFLLTAVDYDLPLMLHDMRAELGERSREMLGAAFYGGIIAVVAEVVATGQRSGELRDEASGGLNAAAGAGLFMSFVAHFLDQPHAGERATRPVGTEARATLLVALLLGGIGTGPGEAT